MHKEKILQIKTNKHIFLTSLVDIVQFGKNIIKLMFMKFLPHKSFIELIQNNP